MFKSAIRAAPRRTVNTRNATPRRFLTTAPPAQKSRSWKNSAVRWGVAVAGVYYYNTSNVFAEEPEATIQKTEESIQHISHSNLPTIDAVIEEKRLRQAERLAEEKKQERVGLQDGDQAEGGDEEGIEGLEAEADQQGAFNPETGEINWDCPCLGGMAHGPCGEEFRAAFSCFVYSKEEPKGIECIEKFKGMQDCFREHPEQYGSELDDDEVEEEIYAQEQAKATEVEAAAPKESDASVPSTSQAVSGIAAKVAQEPHRDSASGTAAGPGPDGDEGGKLVPRAMHDASSK